MNMPVEPQLLSGFFVPGVPPLALSRQRLSGPGYFSLGVDSTIPFISLQGGGASQKVISWGEMIYVRKGQTVTVKNESYMQGDIQINSGEDFCSKPERISLPVTTEITTFDVGLLNFTRVRSLFPADTRRCRRGYLKFQIETNPDPAGTIQFQFTGKPQKHSFPGVDLVTGQRTYTQSYDILPGTQAGSLPLGYGAFLNSIEPMALTDQVHWEFIYQTSLAPTFLNTLFFYVLEY